MIYTGQYLQSMIWGEIMRINSFLAEGLFPALLNNNDRERQIVFYIVKNGLLILLFYRIGKLDFICTR